MGLLYLSCRFLFLVPVLFLTAVGLSQAEPTTHISVLYPKASPAHTRLYQTIIKGMQTSDRLSLSQRSFSDDVDASELEQWVINQQADATVILGKASQQLSLQLDLNIPVVTGAHILASDSSASVCLAAAPDILFAKLTQLSPKVRRVFVIHSERNTGWLIKDAQAAARQRNLKLVPLVIESQTEVASALNEMLQKVEPGRDAIWLPLDPMVPTRTILPKLLKVAWQKDLIIFSNNPIDVKKGILFAMYPDYANMGQQLVAMAQARIQNQGTAQPEASRYLKIALNNRTASHLGIDIDPLLLQQINLIYPRQQD